MPRRPAPAPGHNDKAQIYGEIGLEYGPGIAPRQDHRPRHHPARQKRRAKFVSTIYKQLVVHDLGVTFVDGKAEVTDTSTVHALCAARRTRCTCCA